MKRIFSGHLLLAAVSLLWAAHGYAAPLLRAQTSYMVAAADLGPIVDSHVIESIDGTAQTTTLSNALSRTSPSNPIVRGTASASAQAYATFGTLKVATQSQAAGFAGASASSLAKFADEFRISSPTLDGTTGLLKTRLSYFWETDTFVEHDGVGGIPGQSDASVYLFLSGYAVGFAQTSQKQQYVATPTYESFIDVGQPDGSFVRIPFAYEMELVTEFVFGSTLPFELLMVAGAQGFGGVDSDSGTDLYANATASVQALNSAYWGGLSVSLLDGTDVSDYDFSSGSGTDWRRSFVPTPPSDVPEPSTWALLLAALGGLLLRVRSRTQYLTSSPS